MAVTTTEQIVREAPGIEALKLGLVKSARDLVQGRPTGGMDAEGRPILEGPTIPDQIIAGLAPEQTAAISRGVSGIGAFQPYVTSAGTAMSGALGTLGEAASVARGADTRGQFGQAQSTLGAGIGATLQGMQAPDVAALQQYMNPYQELVTQQALSEMSRQAALQRQGLAAQAAKTGAFGGVREGVQREELNRNLFDIQSRRIAEDLAANYNQAQQRFGEQAGRQLTGAQVLGQLGQGIGSLAGQEYNIGQSMAATLGSLGTQLGNLGVQQAGLGETAQRLGQQDVQFLYNLGEQQRQLEQQRQDAIRNVTLQRNFQPYQQLAFLSDIYKGAPSSSMAITAATVPQPSAFQQAVGLGTAGLASAAAGKTAGLF